MITVCLCTTRLPSPRSPIFQRVIFFLRGYLKSRVYIHKLRTMNDLKEAIRPIDRQLLASVMDDLKKRLENSIQEDGRHLTDIIFKTEPSSMACFKL